MLTETIRTHFQSAKPWRDEEKPFKLLQLLSKYADVGLSPSRYGPSDRRTFDLESLDETEILKIWTKVGGGIIKAPKPWNFLVHIFYIKTTWARAISSLWLHLNEDFFLEEDRSCHFLELCKDIYAWGTMDHGSIAHETEYRIKNELTPGGSVGGPNLKVSLPGVYWANFFGPVYVEWFGLQKFEKIDVFKKEPLEDSGWLLVTRQSPLQYESPNAREIEDWIIKHLGPKAFFEKSNPHKKTETPDLFQGR
jgi:hypothetical protein